jgi:hypothetical protein
VRQKWQAALKKLMAARLTKPGAQLEQQQQQQQQQQDQGPWPAVVVVQGDAAEEQVDLDLFAADASEYTSGDWQLVCMRCAVFAALLMLVRIGTLPSQSPAEE